MNGATKEKNINLIIKVIKPKSKKKPKKERPVETVAGKGYIAAKFLKNNIRWIIISNEFKINVFYFKYDKKLIGLKTMDVYITQK